MLVSATYTVSVDWPAIHAAAKAVDAARSSGPGHPVGCGGLTDPKNTICGVTDTLQVTGLRWLAGDQRETTNVSIESARAFAAGADVSVFSARADVTVRS